jgi:hypothetical protein
MNCFTLEFAIVQVIAWLGCLLVSPLYIDWIPFEHIPKILINSCYPNQ